MVLVSHDGKERTLLVFNHQGLGGAVGRGGLNVVHVAGCPEQIADLDGEDLRVTDKVCLPGCTLRDIADFDGHGRSHEKGESEASALGHCDEDAANLDCSGLGWALDVS